VNALDRSVQLGEEMVSPERPVVWVRRWPHIQPELSIQVGCRECGGQLAAFRAEELPRADEYAAAHARTVHDGSVQMTRWGL
jgi:hypothetical protein